MNKQTERKIGQDRIAEKVIFKRELNHSYMVLPCQDKDMAERYDYRIMQHNRIGGRHSHAAAFFIQQDVEKQAFCCQSGQPTSCLIRFLYRSQKAPVLS